MIKTQLTHEFIVTNQIRLHLVQAGPKDGPLLIMLHGFPEFWQGWRHQIDALAQAGFRLWIPDQRGYGLSDKPKGVAAYSLDELAADVVGLIDAADVKKAVVVGHDWGAAVTWWTANKYPDRLHKIAVLNVPHHAVMNRHIRSNRAQFRKSWYMFFFQLPWLPELSLRVGNWAGGMRMMKASSLPHTFSAEDLAAYRQAWSQPGAMTGMINWYRAIMRVPPQRLSSPRISPPTLMIWGEQDVALGKEMAQPSIDLCDDGSLVFIPEATHWVQHDAPERVNELLLDFLDRPDHG